MKNWEAGSNTIEAFETASLRTINQLISVIVRHVHVVGCDDVGALSHVLDLAIVCVGNSVKEVTS